MGMSNEQLLAGLNSALKAVFDVAGLGASILQPEKAAAFVREARDATVVLPQARFIGMTTPQRDIDRIGFVGRVLKSGKTIAGATRELGDGEFSAPDTATNELIARELQAVVSIEDDTLEENIERGTLEDTILTLASEAVGRDLEEYALLADTNIPFATDDMLHQTSGWLTRAANKVYGLGATPEFDPTAAFVSTTAAILEYPLNMFQARLDALPKRFLQDPAQWRFFVPWAIFDAYRTSLVNRGTVLGDRAITENLLPAFKGIPVQYAPGLERAAEVAVSDDGLPTGAMSLLTHPNNLVWGVLREVRMEPDRLPKKRRADFVFTVRADADYEDENGAVVAYVEHINPIAS